MFMLSFFEVPRGVLKKTDYYISRFYNTKRSTVSRDGKSFANQKTREGLWLFRLYNEDGMWQQLIRNKYLKNKTLSQVCKKPGDSHFWSSLMAIKTQFLNLESFIKMGPKLDFGKICGDQPLKYNFPSLFNIVRKKNATVAEVLCSSSLNISFRRALTGNKLTQWHNLVLRTMNAELTEGNDVFSWKLHRNGSFSVRSMYKHLINNNISVSQDIWRTQLPLKIKIFLWCTLKKGCRGYNCTLDPPLI
ncbi:LOW QUALITY PROTEIN: hypothetical protein U9M48_000835, partial [Paspalum notatum var. saurae]